MLFFRKADLSDFLKIANDLECLHISIKLGALRSFKMPTQIKSLVQNLCMVKQYKLAKKYSKDFERYQQDHCESIFHRDSLQWEDEDAEIELGSVYRVRGEAANLEMIQYEHAQAYINTFPVKMGRTGRFHHISYLPGKQMIIHEEPNIRVFLGDSFPEFHLYEIRNKSKQHASEIKMRFVKGQEEVIGEALRCSRLERGWCKEHQIQFINITVQHNPYPESFNETVHWFQKTDGE